jgi:hypothetical protein
MAGMNEKIAEIQACANKLRLTALDLALEAGVEGAHLGPVMLTGRNLVFFLLFTSVLTGCLREKIIGEGKEAYPESPLDYMKPIEINSPDGLAQYSGNSYIDMINGKVNPEDAFRELLKYSTAVSQDMMKDQLPSFVDNIELSRKFFEARGRSIKGYVYSKAIYPDKSSASIYRIQIMDDDKLYYFKQDFILENETWKIRGDNVIDPFKIILNG